jgi:hypothetical protein
MVPRGAEYGAVRLSPGASHIAPVCTLAGAATGDRVDSCAKKAREKRSRPGGIRTPDQGIMRPLPKPRNRRTRVAKTPWSLPTSVNAIWPISNAIRSRFYMEFAGLPRILYRILSQWCLASPPPAYIVHERKQKCPSHADCEGEHRTGKGMPVNSLSPRRHLQF